MTIAIEGLEPAPRDLNAHLWARHPDDWYVEPSFVSQRLFATEDFRGTIWDPACGLGRIVQSVRADGLMAVGTDLVRRGQLSDTVCSEEIDFLACDRLSQNIVSNPPYGIAQEFAVHALRSALNKVALLLPSKWLYGDKRSRWLETTPLRKVLALTPRPSMPPGPVIEAGIAPGGGKEDYAWFIWEIGYEGRPELGWLRRDP